MLDGIAEKTDGKRVVAMKQFLRDHEVRIMTNAKVVEICETGIVLDTEGVKEYLPCDGVVISAGYHPNNILEAGLESVRDKLVVIGDAVQCANAMESARMGFEAGYNA
jgi:NADH dehydrogenase FAD-containing subunit